MTVGDQTTHQVDQKIGGATMARVLNLGDVFELVVDGFNDRTSA